MKDTLTKITDHTLFSWSIVAVLIGCVIFIMGINSKAEMADAKADNLTQKVSNLPSREEFDQVQDTLTVIQSDIKTILRQTK